MLFAGAGATAVSAALVARDVLRAPAPAILGPPGAIGQNATGWLIPQLFGARADGSDDTAAFYDMAAAAVRERRPMRIPDPGGRYLLAPWKLPEANGLKIAGASTRTAALVPVSANQPHILFIPRGAVGCTIENVFLFDSERPSDARCVTALLSDAAQELRIRQLRVDGAKTGIWVREGAYHRFESIYVARASKRYFAFGGNANGRQVSQSWFYELGCDGGLQDGDEDAAVGVAFDIDSGSAFLHFMSPTAAGQDIGFYVHDGREEGLSSRPDGIFIWDANIDWVKSEAVLVKSVGRMLMHGGNLRSVKSYASRLSGFNSIEWDSTNAYASHVGGLSIEGGFNDFYFKAGSRVIGNGWPSAPGGVGVRIGAGSGRVHLEGGVIGNGEEGPRPGSGYYALGTTSRQDYGLVIAEDYSGELIIDGTRFDHNRVAPFIGLIKDGKLRPRTRIRNVDVFRTDSFGILHGVQPDDGTGTISIEHNLALPPLWYRVDALQPNIDVVVGGVDGRAINVYLRNTNGVRITKGVYDLRWEARI